jgi:hypothetical protein
MCSASRRDPPRRDREPERACREPQCERGRAGARRARNALPLGDLLRIKTTGVHVNELSTFFERETGRVDLDSVNPSWLIFSDGFSAGRRLSSVAKRIFDLVASLILVVLAAPLIAVTAILIKLESRGPAFYRQMRVGLFGEEFAILKLRSMRVDAEVGGKAVWAEKDDPRITRVGRIIRKLRIDELPQVWTVLTGHMSFVGPRPSGSSSSPTWRRGCLIMPSGTW